MNLFVYMNIRHSYSGITGGRTLVLPLFCKHKRNDMQETQNHTTNKPQQTGRRWRDTEKMYAGIALWNLTASAADRCTADLLQIE